MGSKIIYSGGSPATVMRELVAATREALEDAVEYWHDEFLDDHFTPAGGRKYDYQPRSGDDEPPRIPNPNQAKNVARGFRAPATISNPHYSWRKRREKRHNKPLVWSGQSEQMAKAGARVSSRRRGDVVTAAAAMNLPRYFYAYRKDQSQPDKAAELTRTTPDEVEQLGAILLRSVDRRVDRGGRTETVNV